MPKNFPDMMGRMITGQQMRDARVRAGMSREEVAKFLGERVKNVGNWERGHVPPGKEALVRDLLFPDNPLEQYDDLTLLMELGRRLAAKRQEVEPVSGRITPDAERSDRPTSTSVEGKAGPHSSPRVSR